MAARPRSKTPRTDEALALWESGELPPTVKKRNRAPASEGSVWDTQASAEANYQATRALLENPDLNPLQVRALLLRHIEFGHKALSAVFSVDEARAFMEDVLAVLDEVDPDLRSRVLQRLHQRRLARAAFVAR